MACTTLRLQGQHNGREFFLSFLNKSTKLVCTRLRKYPQLTSLITVFCVETVKVTFWQWRLSKMTTEIYC